MLVAILQEVTEVNTYGTLRQTKEPNSWIIFTKHTRDESHALVLHYLTQNTANLIHLNSRC